MMIHVVYTVAKKEIMDNIRNKWIVLISILFASLTLLVSYAGSFFSSGWQDLGFTISAMIFLVQLLISIIGLILGYGAVVVEAEQGSINYLLSLPTTRRDVLIGKFLGLSLVLSIPVAVGFGVAGVIIGANVSNVNYEEYLIFIGASLLTGLVFLSLGMFISCLFKKRSTAMGGAIFTWFFFSIIWRFITVWMFNMAVGSPENLASKGVPDWWYALRLFSPLDTYSTLVSLSVDAVNWNQSDIGAMSYPSFYTSELMIAVLVMWIVLSLIAALWLFKRKDL
ncbi:MAG TPA: ABC transporter permease [Thermoplasmatales archaeon]|nr:ABC transporter permease [Thermoplasmatales archaeon]